MFKQKYSALVIYLVEGMNKKLPREKRLPTSMNNLVERFSCSPDQACIFSQCDHCHQHSIPVGAFDTDFIASGSERSSNDTDDVNQHVTFYEWYRDDGKLKKQLYHLNVEDFLKKFQEAIEVAKRHIHVKRVPVNCYNDIKENIKENDVILHVYYSGNYEYKHQNEVRCAYFGQKTFSIFMVCCYLKHESGKLEKESVMLTSEISDCSRSATIYTL